MILSKTAKGLAALKEQSHGFSRDHYHFLGMVDGHSSVTVLTERSGLGKALAEQIVDHLLAAHLVHEVLDSSQLNDFLINDRPVVSVVELDPEEGVRAWAEAQRGIRGLHNEGFYAHNVRPFDEERKRPSVLSVEDDPIMARLLIVLLQKEGFEVRHAEDLKSMINALNQSMPDLIILDVMLPDASGFKILEWIRSHPRMTNLPVIMLTSQVSAEDVMHGLRAGADGYIFKPFSLQPLLECIRGVLKLQ